MSIALRTALLALGYSLAQADDAYAEIKTSVSERHPGFSIEYSGTIGCATVGDNDPKKLEEGSRAFEELVAAAAKSRAAFAQSFAAALDRFRSGKHPLSRYTCLLEATGKPDGLFAERGGVLFKPFVSEGEFAPSSVTLELKANTNLLLLRMLTRQFNAAQLLPDGAIAQRPPSAEPIALNAVADYQREVPELLKMGAKLPADKPWFLSRVGDLPNDLESLYRYYVADPALARAVEKAPIPTAPTDDDVSIVNRHRRGPALLLKLKLVERLLSNRVGSPSDYLETLRRPDIEFDSDMLALVTDADWKTHKAKIAKALKTWDKDAIFRADFIDRQTLDEFLAFECR
jgi:hypothetical protein